MMQIDRAPGFDRQLKRLLKKHYSKDDYKAALKALRDQDETMLRRLKDHALHGNLAGYRELHIGPDWLLLYERRNDILTLVLTATGSHSDLFSN